MPNLHLYGPAHYPLTARRDLARRMADPYAGIMQTAPEPGDVCFREAGEGGLWPCGAGEFTVADVLSREIIAAGRRNSAHNRPAPPIDACSEARGLDPTRPAIEFTQHAGDELLRKVRSTASCGADAAGTGRRTRRWPR